MPTSNRLSMFIGILMLVLFPFFFTQVALVSLQKLHLSSDTAFRLMLAIVFGGLINIPVKRFVQHRPVWSHPLAAYGLDKAMPRWLPVSGTMQPVNQATVKAKVSGDVRQITVREGDDVQDAARLLVHEGVHRLPVINAEQIVVGVISTLDVLSSTIEPRRT